MAMDTAQKTESLAQLVQDIEKKIVVLPEFQRDFRWEVDKTYDLFDSIVRDIFIGSLIYGVPSFEITVRELDTRPRRGTGSRKKLDLKSYSKDEIDRLVKTAGFRLLLDGQQRATSIYRALKGTDPIFFVLKFDHEMTSDIRAIPASKRSLEQALLEFRGDPIPGRVNISLHDVYQVYLGDAPRERDKVPLFLRDSKLPDVTEENAEGTAEFVSYLTQLKNLENLFRQEKLVAYYLLDTDEEKFALFFERSNSKGIQLDSIDILAAKLYSGFNLRDEIDKFREETPSLELNREALVRAISFWVSDGKETGRAYILSTLNHHHFTAHWPIFTHLYRKSYDYLLKNKLLIHPSWIPYENMLIPMMIFLRSLPGSDFSQMNELQRRVLDTWYWCSILSRRYSSAAQTYVLEDAQMLRQVARGDFRGTGKALRAMNPLVARWEDLLTISKKYDALYKGILNLANYHAGGFRNLENGTMASAASLLEDHHIFPKDYLKKNWEKELINTDEDLAIDCVANRTLIPKLTNVKASNKPPSAYLSELLKVNPNLKSALDSHLCDESLITGHYNDAYDLFLEERGKALVGAITSDVLGPRTVLLSELQAKSAAA